MLDRKLQTEIDLSFLKELKGVDVVSARIFRVYGKGSRDIISRWITGVLSGKSIQVFSKNNCFDYIYAEDVADGILCMCANDLKNTVYNLGTGIHTSIEDVVSIIKNKFNNVKIYESDGEIFPEQSAADMRSLCQETGWAPKYSISDGIEEIIIYNEEKA